MAKKIGALWLKMSQAGEPFYSGVIRDIRGDIQIVVFKNTRKETESQPDYNIVLSEPRKGNAAIAEAGDDVPEEITV